MKSISRLFSKAFLILLFLAACTSPQTKLSGEIKEAEKKLFGDSSLVPSPKSARDMIALYSKYADQFPDDTASAAYLFKAGDLSSKLNETEASIAYFSKLISKYPNSVNAPVALFLQGFIYENQAGNPMKAKPYYEEFLRKYPDHPLTGDVQFSLDHLGKTPEELIKEFELNSDSSTVTTLPAP